MSKRSKLVMIMMLIAILVVTLGCSAPAKSNAPAPQAENKPAAAEPVKLKLAHGLAPTDIHGKAYQFYADKVKELSKGSINIEVFAGGSLAQNPQMFKAVQSGVADIGIFPSSFVAPMMKEVTICEIPGMFDYKNIPGVQEKIAPIMDKIHAKYGMKYLWPTAEGETVLAVMKKAGKPVKTLEDMKGLKVRDYGQWVGKALATWGAVQTTIPPADLNAALDRGTVDGSLASWSFSFGFKVHEQAPYFTMMGASNMWHWAVISDNAWKKLSADQQKVLVDAGKLAMEYSVKIEAEDKEVFKKAVAAVGGATYDLPKEERDKFLAKSSVLFDEVRKISGPEGNELIDTFLSMKK